VMRLQISGAGDNLSVDAERADVQSVLRALLKQAGKQFAPDATVTGQVTLLLTDQPLDTALRSICDASYLKYSETPDGIYRFTRDDAAVKRAFTSLSALNAQLRAQLRALGVDVPPDERLAIAQTENRSAGGFGGSAFGLRDAAKPDGAVNRPAPGSPAGAAGPAQPSDGPAVNAKRSAQSPLAGTLSKNFAGTANVHAYIIPQNGNANAIGRGVQSSLGTQLDVHSLALQNGFVWFNIPEEKPEPVTSVLQLFSQQANVPILVDQSIPNSLKFRVWGSISPRQLPEALNVLAPTAHLQWRWIGGSIFVVPAPNFSVSFGDSPAFRSQYPAPARQENSAQPESRARRSRSD
ncbi:MAG TPA: hypothetical protein VKT77_00065, partial [Chthonomonadaceae bacterium]|nr:hypothetical protein [Chthonomonadaceae bacterium]